ncbi:MAG: hypothetical protein AAB536_01040 [Patescibacteria group bacterium]
MNQRGFVNIVLILIGVIIIVGGIGYFVLRNNQTLPTTRGPEQAPSPTNTITQPTSTPPQGQIPQNQNMSIYQNVTYGFRVEYPKTWEAIEATIKGVPKQSTWAGNVLQGDELHKVTFLEKEYGVWQADFAVRVLPNSENLSIKQWREAQLQKSDAEQVQCRKENPESPCLSARDLQRGEEQITFNGLTAYKISIFGFDHTRECIQVIKNKFVYDLCYDGANPNDPDFDKHREITTDILASFKFLN